MADFGHHRDAGVNWNARSVGGDVGGQRRSVGGSPEDAGGLGGGDATTRAAGGGAGAAAGIVTTSGPLAGDVAGRHMASYRSDAIFRSIHAIRA